MHCSLAKKAVFFFQQSFFLLSNRESDLKIAKARQIRVKTAALIHVICNGRHGPIAVLLVVSAQYGNAGCGVFNRGIQN